MFPVRKLATSLLAVMALLLAALPARAQLLPCEAITLVVPWNAGGATDVLFRIIAERFLPKWWEDLDKTLSTDLLTDYTNIHRFDCSEEHRGGHGAAGLWLNAPNPSPEGDGWLKVVAANGGKPPATEPLKPLLAKVEGEGGRYTLNDGLPKQTGHSLDSSSIGAPNCRTFTVNVSGAESVAALDAVIKGEQFAPVRALAGFNNVFRSIRPTTGIYLVQVVFQDSDALSALVSSEVEVELTNGLKSAAGGAKIEVATTKLESL